MTENNKYGLTRDIPEDVKRKVRKRCGFGCVICGLRENLRVNQKLETDDRELIMRLEPLYQRNREQAKEEGRQEGEKNLILRLLHRRIGEIDALLIERITGLSIEHLENLGEALLDFSSVADLEAWLNQHSI